jgi:hypothetical protein
MMDYNWGMNGTANGIGPFGLLMYIVVMVDLVLLGIWLYKQITKKK